MSQTDRNAPREQGSEEVTLGFPQNPNKQERNKKNDCTSVSIIEHNNYSTKNEFCFCFERLSNKSRSLKRLKEQLRNVGIS
jgi:hypothetical protein